MTFELPKLPYEYNALNPYISSKTLEFHHGKHHNAYVTNLNNLIKGTKFENMSLEEIIKVSEHENAGIFNNSAQVFNHTFFFNCMKKNGGGKVPEIIAKEFGGENAFLEAFKKTALTLFGSGWAWLLKDKFGSLKIIGTENAKNPLILESTPLLCIDVWEHAYYLDYQNKRADFINVFMEHLVNWDFVLENLK